MEKFLNWFAVSSVDANKWSMSLQGLLVANIGVIMFILHYFNVGLSIEQVTDIIGYATGFLGSAMLAAGLIRKIYHTFAR